MKDIQKDSSRELEDNFDNNEIGQLHEAVLGFSRQCFEIKKICVTIEASACTAVAIFIRDMSEGNGFSLVLKIVVLLIPIMFYFVDSCTYYYQDKLRKTMFDIKNRIRERHGVQPKLDDRFSDKNSTFMKRYLRSIRDLSNVVYWGLILFAILFFVYV